jgi:hypothetical protein
LVGRLASRALTLALDDTNPPDIVVDHLLRLARGNAAALDRAAGQVERRHHRPECATAQLAIRSLRGAAAVAVGAQAPPAERVTGALT